MMTAAWQPSGTWKQRFRAALGNAYNALEMEILTSDFFGTRTLSAVSPPGGAGVTYEFQLQQYIENARRNDFLPDLVNAAHQRRPKNPTLTAIAEDLGLTSAGARLDNPTGRPLEELIQANAKFLNIAVFHERLPPLEAQLCRIEIPGGGGTGFLVASDLVLTNYHVIERVQKGQASWQSVVCEFDFRQSLDGTETDPRHRTRVKLIGANWLNGFLPPSQFDWQPQLGEATTQEADCALIQLAEKVGELPVGGASADPKSPPRRWMDLSVAGSPVSAGNQLFILQHPAGGPMQLTVGTVTQFNHTGTRIRYDANSKAGSSGSPCFNADLEIVALHHSHDPAKPPQWNQGITIQLVQNFLRTQRVIT